MGKINNPDDEINTSRTYILWSSIVAFVSAFFIGIVFVISLFSPFDSDLEEEINTLYMVTEKVTDNGNIKKEKENVDIKPNPYIRYIQKQPYQPQQLYTVNE